MRASLLFLLCAALLVSCLLLGGGTSSGLLPDVMLQMLAVAVLAVCFWRRPKRPLPLDARRALAFCAALTSLPLAQLIPLPPFIWTRLPNSDALAATFELLREPLPWRPISVAPRATWLAALSLLPPVALVCAMLRLDYRERRKLSLLLLAVALLGVFVGLTQVAQGPASRWRFFEVTNLTEAVGFFANRNHFAALLYVSTLFAAVWSINSAVTLRENLLQKKHDTIAILYAIAAFTAVVMLVAAQTMARSRAGLGLTIVALVGGLVLAAPISGSRSSLTPKRLLFGATALAILFATQFSLYRVLERFAEDPLADARIAFARVAAGAAKAYMPFGSGMGTFAPVYAAHELPSDALANTFVNRAHNDVLELWLESGVAGLALLAALAGWFIVRAIAVWRHRNPEALDIDVALARAATIIIPLIAVHSLVDYPLRTAAMASVVAFACCLMIEPLPSRKFAKKLDLRPARPAEHRLGDRSPTPAQHAALSALSARTRDRRPAAPQSADKQWGKDIEWPETWRPASSKANRRP